MRERRKRKQVLVGSRTENMQHMHAASFKRKWKMNEMDERGAQGKGKDREDDDK